MSHAAANHLTGLALMASSVVCLLGSLVQAEAPKWELAWQDDFDSLDGSTWTRISSTEPTNNSLHAYLPQQVATEQGKLVITATDEPYAGLPYRSGQVISKAEQLYGRWEVRAKLPTSQGMWPAIWLLPDVSKHNWPSGGEIDIMENRGNQPFLTSSAFHYGTNPPYRHDFVYSEQRTAIAGELVNYHDSYHTYAVDWTSRYLRFYVDGVHHYTVFDEDVGSFLSQSVQPMQLVINNAIGGTFLPNPDASTQWPQQMHVDWVRVYELQEGPGEAAFFNGDFEANGGTLAGWSLFGANTAQTQNATASNEAVLDGGSSLKLFGAFGGGGRFTGVTQGITTTGGERVTASASAFVQSQDSIANTDNRLLMKIEFYDEFGAKYGDGMLGEFEHTVADGQVVNDIWTEHTLEAITPEGAVEARLAFVFDQPGNAGGAVHLDAVSFAAAPPLAAGDFNGDGRVNAIDYALWRDTEGRTNGRLPADGNNDGRVDRADYQLWSETYGEQTHEPISQATPEPGGAAIAVAGVAVSTLLSPARRDAAEKPTDSP